MRLHRKLGGLLAAAMMIAGVTAAVAAPAHAAGATYWQISTGPSVGTIFPQCLEVEPSLAVLQENCDPVLLNTSQEWLPISLGGDAYKFENRATGLCLWAFEVGPPHNGVPITVSDCTVNDTNSRWAHSNNFPGTEPLGSKVAGSFGFCLDVPGASPFSGIQLQLFQCNGTAAQKFTFSHPVTG
jgi:hypothetical protein